MWPRLGPIPTYAIFYSTGILSHYLITYSRRGRLTVLLAKRLGLRHRVWMAVSICYSLGMIVGAKALYDLQRGQFNGRALLSLNHYLTGGLRARTAGLSLLVRAAGLDAIQSPSTRSASGLRAQASRAQPRDPGARSGGVIDSGPVDLRQARMLV